MLKSRGLKALIAFLLFPLGSSAVLASPAFLKGDEVKYSATLIQFPGYLERETISAVNESGALAGTGGYQGQGNDCIYATTANGVIDLMPEVSPCSVAGMNSSGFVIGTVNASGPQAFAWRNGSFQEISSAVGSFYAINKSGHTVAGLSGGGLAIYRLSDQKVSRLLYNRSNGCPMSDAWVLTDGGVVLGADVCQGTLRYETASNGGFNYFSLPSGYFISRGPEQLPMNDKEQIVIYKHGSGHPYLWSTKGGTPLDLGSLTDDPQGTYTATALNNTTIVGTTSDNFAWLWTAKAGMLDLGTLFSNPYGVIIPQAIDNRGDIGCEVGTLNAWLYLTPARAQ